MKYVLHLLILSAILSLNVLLAQSLPTQTSDIFSGSGNCAVCHEPGMPNPNALLGPNGEDVSSTTLWRSTMMANAAKDPFWQAKVSAEVAAHPQYQTLIEDKCLTCHSPQGRTEALYNGSQYYTLQEMQNDPLALDGVTCSACHQIQDVNLGDTSSFSGNYFIENIRIIYGPFEQPFEQPMVSSVHYFPIYSSHVMRSEFCATCHTLFTPTIDNNGQIVGEAPEQVPYLEWLNSSYPADSIECQTCHMPALDFPVTISNMPFWLQSRIPYYKHYFVGANTFMLKILKNHAAEIGVTATPEQFDSTIARTLKQLQKETVDLDVNYKWQNSDTLEVKVAIKNKTGHKFPTAYPSRRAWIYLGLNTNGGQNIFESGSWDTQSGEINGLDSPYEVHHDLITEQSQIQVYEAMIKDVDDEITYTLLRAAGFKKDNRVPPTGFSSSGPSYDSTKIEGLAVVDQNFNRSNGVEGTGTDTVTYRIGGLNQSNSYQGFVKLYYQSLAPRYVQDLFQYNTPEVAKFQNYYQQADKSPVLIDSVQFSTGPTSIRTDELLLPDSPILFRTFPNPFNPVITLEIETSVIGSADVTIYNLLGEKIRSLKISGLITGKQSIQWDATNNAGLNVATGEYIVEVLFKEQATKRIYKKYSKILFLK